MRPSSGYASNLGSTKPSYFCGRGRGLDFVASRLENAGTHDHQSPKFARRAGQRGFRYPRAQDRPANPAPASEGVGTSERLRADIPCGVGHYVRNASKALCRSIREIRAQDVAASREEDALPLLHLA